MNRLLAVDKPPTCAGEWVMPPGLQDAPQILIESCQVHHGLHVTACDEDGGHLIVGHHPERRSLAALHAYGRSLEYDRNWMGDGYEDAAMILTHRWMVLDAIPDEPDAAWSGRWAPSDAPGAFPVTTWLP